MGKPKLKTTDTILKSGAVINRKGVEIHPAGTFMSTSNPKFKLKNNIKNNKSTGSTSNGSKSNGSKSTDKESNFDKWRNKHAKKLGQIEDVTAFGAKAIQKGNFSEGLGVGTGSGGPITQGAPASVGGDEFASYQKESDKLKNRKTSGYA